MKIPDARERLKMYVKDGATILADSSRVLGGILTRPVVLFASRPLKVDATNQRTDGIRDRTLVDLH